MPFTVPPSAVAVPVPPPPKTANYTFASGDDGVPVQFNATAGQITGSLPDPNTVAGMTFIAKKIDASANAVIIASSAFIDGLPSVTLADQYSGLIVMAVNGAYSIVAETAI